MIPGFEILRLVAVPIAMAIFIVAAQSAGGLTLRKSPVVPPQVVSLR